MYGIYKIEYEWDSNLIEDEREWLKISGIDNKALIGRFGTVDEAKKAMSLLNDVECSYGDGRVFKRLYRIEEV